MASEAPPKGESLMALPLTKEMLAAAYDYLCTTPPFAKWRLPASEEVKFAISKHRDRYAHYQLLNGVHHIVLSSHYVGRHDSLMVTLAHEMIHLHQAQTCNWGHPHGKAFQKYADRICKIHDFDRLTF